MQQKVENETRLSISDYFAHGHCRITSTQRSRVMSRISSIMLVPWFFRHSPVRPQTGDESSNDGDRYYSDTRCRALLFKIHRVRCTRYWRRTRGLSCYSNHAWRTFFPIVMAFPMSTKTSSSTPSPSICPAFTGVPTISHSDTALLSADRLIDSFRWFFSLSLLSSSSSEKLNMLEHVRLKLNFAASGDGTWIGWCVTPSLTESDLFGYTMDNIYHHAKDNTKVTRINNYLSI